MIDVCYAFLETDSENIPARNLRGFLGHLFVNETEFHHHTELAHQSYHYPLIQYKKIDEKLLVLGLNEYSKVVFNQISQLDKVVSEKGKHEITSVELMTQSFDIKEEETEYEFVSPWIALNQKNYQTYQTLKGKEKDRFLEKILVGNLLSTLKGLGIRIDFQLLVRIKKVYPVKTHVHHNDFEGFLGTILTNVSLPKYVGIGKSVSKGFGILNTSKRE